MKPVEFHPSAAADAHEAAAHYANIRAPQLREAKAFANVYQAAVAAVYAARSTTG